MTDLLTVWTPGSVIAAVIGGILLGVAVVARFDNPRFEAAESVGVVVVIGVLAGVVFWSGQIVDTLFADGPSLAWRVISRFLLWIVFTVCLGLGTGVGIRLHRGSWS